MTNKKLNLAVLMGGKTAEHIISLSTGEVIVEALHRSKYNIKPIQITKQGKWIIPDKFITEDGPNTKEVEVVLSPDAEKNAPCLSPGVAIDKIIADQIDAVFVAMHGPYGEDGVIQGLLEVLGIPYTGSGVTASGLAMDKIKCKEILCHHDVTVPKHYVVEEHAWKQNSKALLPNISEKVGYPCVAKVPCLGSSVGMAILPSEEVVLPAFEQLFRYDWTIMVEEFIKGTEITCSVLGNSIGKEPIALPVTEIVPKGGGYFDYKAKYTPGATDEITPARISDELTAHAQETSRRVHKILGCGGMSRTDMIIRDGETYVLETNTIPGMTQTSLYPQAAKAAGIDFPDLLDRLIELAIETHQSKRDFHEIK